MPTKSKKYVNTKISEEAKIAIDTIRAYHKPDMELQELNSLAIMEYLHAYYPALEKTVSDIMNKRKAARRGDAAEQQ